MNDLAEMSDEELLFAVSDDILFRTQGWDEILCAAFERYPDRLLLAYTNDGLDRDKCTHFAVHRYWLYLSGYFVWPEFEHFYADEWCFRIGAAIGRTLYLRELVTEHMHFKYGKSEKDETYSSKRGNGISSRDKARMEKLMPMVNEIAVRMRHSMVAHEPA
jgi:glycosyl transferase/beta-hydroxylase protein BlmF